MSLKDREGRSTDVLSYYMRMGEKMPKFNYWPRGREIIHRLIMKAATPGIKLSDLELTSVDEDTLRSLIFTEEYDPSTDKVGQQI